MIKSVKEKIGHMQCLGIDCDTRVPVWKDSVTGALSFSCHECRAPGYAKNDGSPHYKNVLARATASNVPADAPAPVKKTSPLFC